MFTQEMIEMMVLMYLINLGCLKIAYGRARSIYSGKYVCKV